MTEKEVRVNGHFTIGNLITDTPSNGLSFIIEADGPCLDCGAAEKPERVAWLSHDEVREAYTVLGRWLMEQDEPSAPINPKHVHIIQWDEYPLLDTACAVCSIPFAEDDTTMPQYAAFLFHLNEPDRVCSGCASATQESRLLDI